MHDQLLSRRTLLRTSLVLPVAAATEVVLPKEAQAAVTGGWFSNSKDSGTSIRAWYYSGGTLYYKSIPAGSNTSAYGIANVVGFSTPSSVWPIKNMATGYVYSGGVYHPYSANNLRLNFLTIYVP